MKEYGLPPRRPIASETAPSETTPSCLPFKIYNPFSRRFSLRGVALLLRLKGGTTTPGYKKVVPGLIDEYEGKVEKAKSFSLGSNKAKGKTKKGVKIRIDVAELPGDPDKWKVEVQWGGGNGSNGGTICQATFNPNDVTTEETVAEVFKDLREAYENAE